ncbi:hypothetical protein D3C72_2014210 [compost metagenome]
MTVVAVDFHEAAGIEQPAQLAVALDGQALHGMGVVLEMGLAGKCQGAAAGAQVFAEGQLADRQGHTIPGRAMRRGIPPRVIRHARGPAYT